MAPRKRGRKPGPPPPTQKQFEDMARFLSLGLTVVDVCALVGLGKTTFYKWVAEGKTRTDPDDPARKFADSVSKGKLSAKAFALGCVQKGMPKDWKSAAWYLGVTYPKEFGPKVKVTLEAEFSAALERLKAVLPPELYEKAVDALAGGDGEDGEGEDSVGAALGSLGPGGPL